MTNLQNLLEEKIKATLLDDTDMLEETVREINSWNGSLENLEVYSNDEEFFDMMFEGKPMEAVRATQYGEYNYNDEYVSFNGYGNLVSYDTWEYQELLKDSIDEIVDALIDCIDSVTVDTELDEIFEMHNLLEELFELTLIEEYEVLTENLQKRYVELVEELQEHEVEIPFGINI